MTPLAESAVHDPLFGWSEQFTCPSGRTCRITHPPTKKPEFTSVFAFSLHKAGSTLYTKVLDDLARAAGVAVVNIPGELFPQGIHEADFPELKKDFFQPKGYIYSGYRTFPEMFEFPENMPENAGLLIRDPRDILVSMYFSFTGSHPIAQKDPEIRKKIEDIRRRENERGICRYILRHAHMAEAEFRSYEPFLKQIKVWRYEDIIFDKIEWVKQIARRFKLQLPEAKLVQIAEKHDIRPESEQPHSHIRKVAPGDAGEKLSPRMLALLDRRFRNILRRHKYETYAEKAAAAGQAQKPHKLWKPVAKATRWVRKRLQFVTSHGRPTGEFANAIPLESPVDPLTIERYTFSRATHYHQLVARFSKQLYGHLIDVNRSALKCYQDLLCLAFIEDNIPRGSRILDVGGGQSRILQHLARDYDCWLIDDFQGGGNGPTEAARHGYKTVKGLMGQFLRDQLPDDHFDCVFSVSALEHCPQRPEVIQSVLDDLDRVTKPGGMNIHCLDWVIRREKDHIDNIPVVQQMFFDRAVYPLPSPRVIVQDPDMFKLPREIYATWKIPHPYEQVAIIDTCAFWPKGDIR